MLLYLRIVISGERRWSDVISCFVSSYRLRREDKPPFLVIANAEVLFVIICNAAPSAYGNLVLNLKSFQHILISKYYPRRDYIAISDDF